VKQSEIDAGARAGLSTSEQDELKELRKEVRELRRSNYILQVAATFFGALVEIAGEGNRAVVGRLTN
jgi:transposase-like protein